MIKPNALPMKLFFPKMLHVTTVWPASGWNVNSAVLVALNGFRNSSRMRIKSAGWLSVMGIRPSPTFLLPAQAQFALVPAGGPFYVFLHAGSSLAHGDHASYR